jgi:hypothetical protein
MKHLIITLLLILPLTACVPVEESTDVTEEASEEIVVEEEVAEEETPVEEATEEEPEEVTKDFEYYTICDNNKFPFEIGEYEEGHGQFVFTGTVVNELEIRPWGFDENDLIPVISMNVSGSDSSAALEYFMGTVDRGNTINSKTGENLRFRIGTYENEEFSSTATISEATLNKMFAAIDSGEEISLTITRPYFHGMGAPANFTFACEISE